MKTPSSLLPLFRWLGHTSVGVFLARSNWGFAAIEMAHLIGLAVLGGEILLIDFQLLGVIRRQADISRAARELLSIFVASLSLMLVSGVLLVSAEALKCYYNPAFRAKMALLFLAILVSWIIHKSALGSSTNRRPSAWLKAAAVLSLLLWLGVGAAGRLIGLL